MAKKRKGKTGKRIIIAIAIIGFVLIGFGLFSPLFMIDFGSAERVGSLTVIGYTSTDHHSCSEHQSDLSQIGLGFVFPVAPECGVKTDMSIQGGAVSWSDRISYQTEDGNWRPVVSPFKYHLSQWMLDNSVVITVGLEAEIGGHTYRGSGTSQAFRDFTGLLHQVLYINMVKWTAPITTTTATTATTTAVSPTTTTTLPDSTTTATTPDEYIPVKKLNDTIGEYPEYESDIEPQPNMLLVYLGIFLIIIAGCGALVMVVRK